MRRAAYFIKPVLALGFLTALVLLWQHPALQSLSSWEGVKAHWASLQVYAESPWALPVLLGLSTVAVVISFPQTILIAVTSMLFSPWIAVATGLLGCTAGAAVTFSLGRWFFRDAILLLAERRQKTALLAELEQGGFRYILTLRVAFFMFFALNWLPGATTIRMRDYLAATFLGAIPWVAVLVLMVEKLQTGDKSAAVWLALPGALVVTVFILRKRLGAKEAKETKDGETALN
jgi:uncharacterized membrane protein YdjX (TVP38/TMEM64 family)